MAANLTSQVRNIAQVATAVANGDLGQKITVDAQGEILELKQAINVMVDQLSSFADEVTRVAREVGTEGKLGGQARVEGVEGIVDHASHASVQLQHVRRTVSRRDPQEEAGRLRLSAVWHRGRSGPLRDEELPADSLNGAYLQVDEARFDQSGIRTLYESQDFPLRAPPACARARARQQRRQRGRRVTSPRRSPSECFAAPWERRLLRVSQFSAAACPASAAASARCGRWRGT